MREAGWRLQTVTISEERRMLMEFLRDTRIELGFKGWVGFI